MRVEEGGLTTGQAQVYNISASQQAQEVVMCDLCKASSYRHRFVTSGSGRRWCRGCHRAVWRGVFGKNKADRLLKKIG